MNYGLLWIDDLMVALLWMALVAACVARLNRKGLRIVLLVAGALAPLFFLGAFVLVSTQMKFVLALDPNWFAYAISLFVASAVGIVVILRRATRREPGMPPGAASWRRAPLAFAWLTAVTVGYMTIVNMDLAFRARCAIISAQLNSLYLVTLPAVTSDAQNAALIYENAFARLRDAQDLEQKVNNPPTGNSDTFDPNEPATIAFLQRQAQTIAMLRRAAAMNACRFDSDLTDLNVSEMIPDLNDERNAANILNLDAREQIARGHVSVAIDDAQAILSMSRQFGQRPLFISFFVGAGIDGMGTETLEEVLPDVKSHDELAGLDLDQLSSMGRVFQQAIRGEQWYGVSLYGQMPQSRPKVSGTVFVPALGAGMGGSFFRVFMLDLDAYLKLMGELQTLAVQPYYRIESEASHDFDLTRGRGLFTSILAPELNRGLQTLAMSEAGDECARTAVAMTRFRLDHGSLPARLTDLVPAYLDAVPTDPFDGHPLRMSIRKDRCVIYSVGPNRVDDGGVKMVNGKGDVIFTLMYNNTESTTKP